MSHPRTQAYASVHLATFLVSFVGIMIQILDLPIVQIALGRSLVACVVLSICLIFFKVSLRLENARDLFWMILLGLLQAGQWLAVFQAIRIAGVAIGLIALFCFPILVVVLEPVFFKEKLSWVGLFAAGGTLFGVWLTVPEFDIANNTTRGVLWGLLSALLVAIPLLIHRRYVQNYSSLTLAFYKLIVVSIVLLPIAMLTSLHLNIQQGLLLCLMGVLFTAVPYILIIRSLRDLQAGQVALVTTLEVVYGIMIAWMLIDEVPTGRVLLGGSVVVGFVVWNGWYAIARAKTG